MVRSRRSSRRPTHSFKTEDGEIAGAIAVCNCFRTGKRKTEKKVLVTLGAAIFAFPIGRKEEGFFKGPAARTTQSSMIRGE